MTDKMLKVENLQVHFEMKQGLPNLCLERRKF